MLRTEVDVVAATLAERLASEIPAYAHVSGPTLVGQLAVNVDLVLEACAPDLPGPRPARLRGAREVGAQRARQGFTLEDLLRGWRLGLEVTYEHAGRLGERHEVPDAVLREFTRALLHSADVANTATAEGHRRVDVASAVVSAQWRARLVRAVLLGEGIETAAHDLALVGFTADTRVRALCADAADDQALVDVLAWLEPQRAHAEPAGLACVVGAHVLGLVREPQPDAAPARPIGLGQVARTGELPASLRGARRALSVATRAGRTGPSTVDDLGVLVPILEEEQVGAALVTRYVAPLRATRSGRAVLATVRAYLDHRQHVDRAAAEGVVHVNTVRYRLRRFEDITGADLRDPWSLLEVCWALRRAEHLPAEPE
jgi:hypothetical protein